MERRAFLVRAPPPEVARETEKHTHSIVLPMHNAYINAYTRARMHSHPSNNAWTINRPPMSLSASHCIRHQSTVISISVSIHARAPAIHTPHPQAQHLLDHVLQGIRVPAKSIGVRDSLCQLQEATDGTQLHKPSREAIVVPTNSAHRLFATRKSDAILHRPHGYARECSFINLQCETELVGRVKRWPANACAIVNE